MWVEEHISKVCFVGVVEDVRECGGVEGGRVYAFCCWGGGWDKGSGCGTAWGRGRAGVEGLSHESAAVRGSAETGDGGWRGALGVIVDGDLRAFGEEGSGGVDGYLGGVVDNPAAVCSRRRAAVVEKAREVSVVA